MFRDSVNGPPQREWTVTLWDVPPLRHGKKPLPIRDKRVYACTCVRVNAMGGTLSVATLARAPTIEAPVYSCMRSHHLNAKQARALVSKGAKPAFVIAVSPTCPACIYLLQVLDSLCVRDASIAEQRLFTMDVDAVRVLWPSLRITHVPKAIYVNGTATAPQLLDAPLVTEQHIRNLLKRVVLAPGMES
jgi:hypothetical protein